MEEREQYNIIIPRTPPSLNMFQHWHWGKKRDVKQEWMTEVKVGVLQAKVPKRCSHVEVYADIIFARPGRRDPQNYAATLYKFLDDALVYAGIIPDDTAEFITHHEPKLFAFKNIGDKTRIILTIRRDGDGRD